MQRPFAAILAGGASRRFGGGPKALAEIGGTTMLGRVRHAVEQAGAAAHLITNTPEPYTAVGLPVRGDAIPGGGALSGVHSAVRWANETGAPFALVVPCDMPLLPPGLLAALLDAAHGGGADIVVPESPGPLGFEPLCAVYAVRVEDALAATLRAGGGSLAGVVERSSSWRLPLADVRRFGDPRLIFMNVNSRTEALQARALLAGHSPPRPVDGR
jgi:molybdenum cofactor guanylyltransferase